MNRQTLQYYAFIRVYAEDFYQDLMSNAVNLIEEDYPPYEGKDLVKILRSYYQSVIVEEAEREFGEELIQEINEYDICALAMQEAEYGSVLDKNDAQTIDVLESVYQLTKAACKAA